MAARSTRRSPAKAKGKGARKAPAAPPPGVVAPEQPDQPAPDGQPELAPCVVVSKGHNDAGAIGVIVQAVGVEPTEVLTLLELAIVRTRADYGLPPLK